MFFFSVICSTPFCFPCGLRKNRARMKFSTKNDLIFFLRAAYCAEGWKNRTASASSLPAGYSEQRCDGRQIRTKGSKNGEGLKSAEAKTFCFLFVFWLVFFFSLPLPFASLVIVLSFPAPRIITFHLAAGKLYVKWIVTSRAIRFAGA